jgi:hypothetical protein
VANTIIRKMLPELEVDRGRIPVVSFELVAPGLNTFNWIDNFKRILCSMDEPLVDFKAAPGTPRYQGRSEKSSAADLRYAYEQALHYRRPVVALLDDAQYLAKATGSRLLDQLDVIKSIASHAKVPHVLFGTYDLLELRNLSGQISRRSVDVHLPRYTGTLKDRDVFASIVMSFAAHMPLEECPAFDLHIDYMLERTGGCVGILKTWLEQALKEALRAGDRTVSVQTLEKRSYSNAALTKIFMEIAEGEESIEMGAEGYTLQRNRLLGAARSTKRIDTEDQTEPLKQRRIGNVRPGQRNPVRDPIGIPQTSA